VRIRTIKPALWDHERLGGCSDAARLLFIGLVSHADDEGRGRATLAFLKARIWAYADKTLAEVQSAIDELAAVVDRDGPLVLFYEVAGERYYSLPSWGRNQLISRKTPSKLPPPPKGLHELSMSPHVTLNELSMSPHVTLHEPSCPEGKGREGKGMDTLVPRPSDVARPLPEAIVSDLHEAGKPVGALKSTGTAPDTTQAIYVDPRPVSGRSGAIQKRSDPPTLATEQLLEVWNEGRKAPCRITPAKVRRVAARLREGWTVEEMTTAIRNLRKSAWHQGQNDRGWTADFDFLFRSSEHIEKWLNHRQNGRLVIEKREDYGPPKL
jgi:hypothetical protein